MSSSQAPSVASLNVGVAGRVSGSVGQLDAQSLAILKRTLLIAALETPPRFRNDIDVAMIEQHLASLGAFAAVAQQILHYLATECTISRIPDGEVLFYQEDMVDDHSQAYVVLEGSLCGYFNKAFSQRHSRGDTFRSWNSKKTNARGVSIDFGDLQVTYGKGAICGIDDFYPSASTKPTREKHRHAKPLCRRRSVHSQESTTIIVLAKDTLDLVSDRFSLVYEKGVLTSTKETSRTDVSQLSLLSLLSDTAKRSLLQTALVRQLQVGQVLFDANVEKNPNANAFVVVRNGRLDIHCVEYGGLNSANAIPTNTENGLTTTKSGPGICALTKDPLVSLTRGQTFGDQMVALGHSHVWMANPRRRPQFDVRFKVVASESSTEVLWITRDHYEQFIREDQLRLSYNPLFGSGYVTSTTTALESAIESREICHITRLVLSDAALSKFFFQFPPLVLDRLCHHMEIQHFVSNGVLIEAGGAIEGVYVVVTGALHSHYVRGSDNDHSTARKALVHQGSFKRMSHGQGVHFIPGDAFGARELMKSWFTSDASVLADPGTMVLCIMRPAFERWISPMRNNTIVKAGSILQPFVWSSTSPPTSPRQVYANNYPIMGKVNRRQSGPSVFSSTIVEPDRGKARRLDEAAILLKRFGLFRTLPRFLLAQMLTHATLLSKSAGDELFREGGTQRALVVILAGFVSFYSLENMSATIDMFQKHPFCIYATFSGSTTSPEDYVSELRADDGTVLPQAAALKHRAAMYGVHIQTLPSRNAFRTGVLEDGTTCPATVIAQTDCEYLLIDESVYSRLLAEHLPAVDMTDYIAALDSTTSSANSTEAPEQQFKAKTPVTNHRQGAVPAPLLAHLEAAHIAWLPPSSAKRTLLLRSMQHVHLVPGQRLIQYNDTLTQLVFVVRGKLAVYVHESHEVAFVLNASQRSVQSAALERSVASNYSTTSQQLYQERSSTIGTANRKALQRKIARIAEIETPASKITSSNARFTDFVMHAAKEVKVRQPDQAEDLEQATLASKPFPGTRRLHTMVNKVNFQRKTGDQSSSSAVGLKETKSLFMLHLGPGDIYGDEVTAPSGIFHSFHDIYADTSAPGSPGMKEPGPKRPETSRMGTEILCLDRQVLHSILAKTEEEAASELEGKLSNAKERWQTASKKFFKRASHSTIEDPGTFVGRKKMPKLFDFFKNILNQRRFLTMGTIAHFPLLRDLSDDAQRELCLNARFEALDRYTDAYKGNGDANGTGHRFFLLLTGRINLVANGPNSHIVAQTPNTSSLDHSLGEVTAGEGFGEFEILMSGAPAYIAAIAAEPTKLLSIPSEMFLRHWPRTQEIRANIEYLQTQIPSLVSLDLERIAYLYHSFSFETHVRGTNIFQLHGTKRSSGSAKEVYLIKEGTCCIRQHVTLINHPDTEFYYNSCCTDRSGTRNDQQLSRTKNNAKTTNILVTVADVGAGHVFWNDDYHYPITLVATSAAVTIASISIDKLRAIVPRGLLVGLESLSRQLRDLYAQQFELAKRVTATVMNEKLAAQNQSPGVLPAIPGSSQKASFSPQSLETQELNIYSNAASESDDAVSILTERANAVYDAQHRIERYNIPSQLPVTYLTGSFLGKPSTSTQQGTTGTEESYERMAAQDWSVKQNECCTPELTAVPIAVQQKEVTGLLRLNVKIPVADRPHSSSNNLAKLTSAAPVQRRRLSKDNKHEMSSSLVKSEDVVVIPSQNEVALYEVDVRARVHAQLSMIGPPMRAIRLEPSHAAVNSLGKYFSDSPSPFSKPGDSYRRQCVQLHTTAAKTLVKAPKHNLKRELESRPNLLQSIVESAVPELTRKQGFLTLLRIRVAFRFDGDGHDFMDAVLPRVHQGRRYFYALVDEELREYADTISLSNIAQTPCLRRYNLCNHRRSCVVHDVPATPGAAEALLRQSFLLIVDDATQLFFTAASTIDKQKWMTELNHACVLGGLQQSISIKVQSPRPIIPTPPPADSAALAAVINAFKGRRRSTIKGRKRSSIFMSKPVDNSLQVEYRISSSG